MSGPVDEQVEVRILRLIECVVVAVGYDNSIVIRG